MNSKPPAKRYTSQLRQTQVELTQRTIMEAMAVVIVEDYEGDIIKRVARQAGVSERTIYRHYPSKQAIWDAFLLWVSHNIGLKSYPETCEEMVRRVPEIFASFDEQEDLMKACLSIQAWSDVWLAGRSGWQEGIERCLTNSFGELDEQSRAHAGALIHLIFNGICWKTLRDQWHMTGEDAGLAAQWSLNALFQDLARRRSTKLKKEEAVKPYAKG